MATVYSLVCWGGRTGKTVTFTDAGDVVNLTNHGLRVGKRLEFSTTGALPTGLSTATTYYVKQGADASKFLLYPTLADAIAGTNQVAFSGAGTGTHTAKSVLMGEYFTQYPGRWGSPGSERCYDGVQAVMSARNAAYSLINEEVIEYGEAFNDYVTTGVTFRVGACPYTRHISAIDGVRTEAFHNGVPGDGYVEWITTNSGHVFGKLTSIDGLQFEHGTTTLTSIMFLVDLGSELLNCILISKNPAAAKGLQIRSGMYNIQRNLIKGFLEGVIHHDSTGSGLFGSNTVTACGTGIVSYGNSLSYRFSTWVNNVSVGNTTNWGVCPTSLEYASGNVGASGDTTWVSSGGVTFTMATSDFADYANGDYRPASANSPQVDIGVDYYGITTTDISDSECPNYNNGGAEAYDVGCYEFDHGFGNHPASTTVTFSGVNAGSEIRVYDASGNELAGVESSTANPELTWVLSTGDVRIVVVHLDYKIKDFQYTPVSGAVSLPVQQEADSWYSNPA